MRKAMRIVIPVILTLAIIVCLGWYLLIYDQEFTRDMLLQGARFFESQGNHETAAWFYGLAYRQAGDNDAVAIELAQQHIATGNYTKAEFVLNQAISDGGGPELYVALSKTYVEQDKLMDAVKLLDAVCREDSTVHSSVKNALMALRPDAPTSTPNPGIYNQYISVSLKSGVGTIYANTSGVYPSVKTDTYRTPITLAGGENTIYAVCVSDKGLVSPLSIFGYTVGNVIEEVRFSDPAIEAEIRKVLKVSNDAVLMTDDLWTITAFTVPSNAADYSDLRYLINLENLTINKGVSGQLHHISTASKLAQLTVTDTAVSSGEVAIIASLPSLESLTLSNCGLSTTAGLEKAVSLTYLDLSENAIRNINALMSMPGLREAYLQKNALSDLNALSQLSALSVLDVSSNALSDLSPLYTLSSLSKLTADHNTVSTLENIGQLKALTELSLSFNQLTDISALKGCTALKKLNISNNTLADISVVASISGLTHLDFSYNQVTKLPKWSSSAALIRIDGSYNKLSSLSNLAGLQRLNAIYMDHNKSISSVSKLADCPVLVLVSVFGTKVSEVRDLTALSIVVYYDPT